MCDECYDVNEGELCDECYDVELCDEMLYDDCYDVNVWTSCMMDVYGIVMMSICGRVV